MLKIYLPIRLKTVLKCAASLGSAPLGPLSAAGRRSSGVTSIGSMASTLPELFKTNECEFLTLMKMPDL